MMTMTRTGRAVLLGCCVVAVLAGGASQALAQGTGSAAAPSTAGRMLRPKLLIHVVANLEKSVAFYHDNFDFQVASGPSPLVGSTLLHKAKAGAPGATARQATLIIPGSNLQLQFIEFAGVQGTPFEQHLYDPGVTRFSIQVRDIDKAFARVKDKVKSIDSVSAGPVYTQRPRNNTRAVMMRDPDGFVFEFVQGDPQGKTDVPESSNITNARSSLAIDNFDSALAFYRDILGFTFANPPGDVNDAVLALEGTPRGNARSSGGMPPGSNNIWFLWEFRNVPRTKHTPNPQDPGASAVTLEVENLPALLARMKSAGIAIETPGGQPVALEGGRKGALVRSPDGMLVELLE